jgi:competence protein ComFC
LKKTLFVRGIIRYNPAMSMMIYQSMLKLAGIQYHKLRRAAGQFLWPAVCAVCSSPIEEDSGNLCRACWQSLSAAVGHDYCRRCGRQVSRYGIVNGRCGGCIEEDLEYEGLCRVGFYDGTLKSMLAGFKFQDKVELMDHIGPVFKQAFTAAGFDSRVQVLVPVPLHWRRRFQRGFNQSYLLAKYLKNKSMQISEDLVRIRYTPHQWQMQTDSQKRRNVRDAFTVREGHPFEGRSVCLVDDITTSGATLVECARTLKEAGAVSVYAAVVAVAERID